MAVISSAVRSNLLALQNTSAQQAISQNRLATGKKVNSALDNPTNFFTASSLNARAAGLSSLLDGMSSGIKTLEAADNGMKAITKNIESMQANIRAARADKSFKGQSFTLDANRTGNITFSGGTVGETPVSVAVGVTPTSTTLESEQDVASSVASGAITVNGKSVNIRGDVASASATTLVANRNVAVAHAGGTVTINGTDVTFDPNDDATAIKAAIDDETITGLTVSDTGGKLSFSLASGADLEIEGDATLLQRIGLGNGTQTTVTSTNGTEVFDATAETIADDIEAAGIDGLQAIENGNRVSLTLTTGADLDLGGPASLLTAIGFASADNRTSTNGTEAGTVDNLVESINANEKLAGKVRASNDGGKLRIENLSTKELTVEGVGNDGEIDGTFGTSKIGGNEVRKNLMQQFNDLRTQIDKLTNDASFNGINLLKADKLKLTFNEDGTNNIEIQAKSVGGEVRGIDTSDKSLSIGEASEDEFSTDADLDVRLNGLSKAVTTLSTQSSTFGAALTTIQTRQDFTKSMINTLQGGADSLVNADLNEESATLLALNTRQQLSQTALSLASQADQAVLRLF